MPRTLNAQRQWSGKTGWCMTGHHNACPGVTLSGRVCACDHPDCPHGGSKPSAGAA